MSTRKSQRAATAHHEAGHVVIAFHLGYKPKAASIIQAGDTAGVVHYPSPLRGIQLDIDDTDRARLRAEKVISICFAGPLAQQRYHPRSWRAYHGQSDYDLITELGLRICGSSEAATAFIRWREIATREMVSTHWGQIETIAKFLLERNRLSRTEIGRALRCP